MNKINLNTINFNGETEGANIPPTNNHLLSSDLSGKIQDSGFHIEDYETHIISGDEKILSWDDPSVTYDIKKLDYYGSALTIDGITRYDVGLLYWDEPEQEWFIEVSGYVDASNENELHNGDIIYTVEDEHHEDVWKPTDRTVIVEGEEITKFVQFTENDKRAFPITHIDAVIDDREIILEFATVAEYKAAKLIGDEICYIVETDEIKYARAPLGPPSNQIWVYLLPNTQYHTYSIDDIDFTEVCNANFVDYEYDEDLDCYKVTFDDTITDIYGDYVEDDNYSNYHGCFFNISINCRRADVPYTVTKIGLNGTEYSRVLGETINFYIYSEDFLVGGKSMLSWRNEIWVMNEAMADVVKNNLNTIDWGGNTFTEIYNIQTDELIYNVIHKDGGCLLPGTQITMADGSTKGVEDIRIGDEVMSIDYDTKEYVSRKIVARKISGGDITEVPTTNKYVIYSFSDGTQLSIANRHRFYNMEAGRWKYMDEWSIGQHAYTINREFVELVSIEKINKTVEYYTLFLEGDEAGYTNYFANGLLSGDRFCPTDFIL